MYLFLILISSLFLTAILYYIGKDYPHLFMFLSLFVNVMALVYIVLKDYGQKLIANQIDT